MIRIISTFFYAGYMPFMPGTFASFAALLLFYSLKGSTPLYVLFTCVFLTLGFLTAGRAERLLGKKDSERIVIDEVSGMLLCLVLIPHDYKLLLCAFLLFRILDTLKPFPAARLQYLRGSLGIMADDLVAAVYTNIILQAVLRWAWLKTS